MRDRFLFGLLILVIGIVYFIPHVEAKVLPRFQSSKAASSGKATSGYFVSPKLRSDRSALIIYFGNLQRVRNVTYTLIYQTNGKDEGVSGSIDSSSGNNATRQLQFATCSSGVCRDHQNLSNMKLEVITELSNGKRTLRRFRLRI